MYVGEGTEGRIQMRSLQNERSYYLMNVEISSYSSVGNATPKQSQAPCSCRSASSPSSLPWPLAPLRDPVAGLRGADPPVGGHHVHRRVLAAVALGAAGQQHHERGAWDQGNGDMEK